MRGAQSSLPPKLAHDEDIVATLASLSVGPRDASS